MLLSGGELGAAVLCDTVIRFNPGVLNNGNLGPLQIHFKITCLPHPYIPEPAAV